jgi:AraC-like DNA-binding protein
MDVLSDLLDGVRFRGRVYCRVEAREPWGLSAAPARVATFHGVVRGDAQLRLVPGGRATALARGDLVMLGHGNGHSIASPGAVPQSSIADALAAAAGTAELRIGGRGRRATLVCGAFVSEDRDLPPLFSFLPALLHVPATAGSAIPTLLELVASEVERGDGARATIARLTEALFVSAMRAWGERGDPTSSRWIAAMRDDHVGHALRLIHQRTAHAWTVRSLARAVGTSRSSFAARFVEVVGETPAAYLTRWRIYLAARQLRETDRAVAEIAADVGYETAASLNKAFKRLMRQPPGAYRTANAAEA